MPQAAACPRCNAAVPAGSRFCGDCGCAIAPLPAPASAPPPAPAPASAPPPAPAPASLPLPTDFTLDTNEYEYAGDRQALNALRSLKVANTMVDYIANKLGKPFIEGQFIGSAIRVSEEQFPHIHRLAVQAATVLCMPRLPQIYISGDRFWNSDTYGTGTDSFIVLGSSLARSLTEIELLFVIAKELGHAKSGHAMYRTVAQIVAGSHSNNLMAGGLLGFLDVKRLVSLPIELPLMSWLRQSEVTADSAGLLVVGDVDIARKTLVLMSLRAPDLYKQINLDVWLKQQDDLDGKVSSLNEFVSQSSPYVSRRVRLLDEYSKTPVFLAARARMAQSADLRATLEAIERLKAAARPAGAGASGATSPVSGAAQPGEGALAPGAVSSPPAPVSDAETIRGRCPSCGGAYSVARAKLPPEGRVHLKCKGCGGTFPVQR